jgi:hypothetical protein
MALAGRTLTIRRHDRGHYSRHGGNVGMPCTSGAGVGVRRALFLPKPPSNYSALSCCARFLQFSILMIVLMIVNIL